MKLFKAFAIALSVAVLSMLAVPRASADEWNHKTTVTFSGPVEVPGVGAQVLPAGTYVFKLVDSNSDRHIVQIFDQTETHVFTTILAIPNYRLQPTDKTVMTFRERPVGEPEALKAWFYPGAQWGEHFVYAKSRAIVLARETNEPVLATPDEPTAAPVQVLMAAPVEAVGPKGESVDLAEVVQPPPATAQAPVAADAPVEVAALPKTASSLPLIGLVGLFSLSMGIGATLVLRRIA